jgi:DNA replication and repair protein RecF
MSIENIYLENLLLVGFRNLLDLSLNVSNGVNIIIGLNGSGKTSILESISLLSPGKGLKSANFDDMCQYGQNGWETRFKLHSKLGIAEIITNFQLQEKSRKISYNGSKIPSAELTNFLNVIWITPQMESIFNASPSVRRRFLDRIVYNFDPQHAKRLSKYEHYIKERNKTLAQRGWESQLSWLGLIEDKITQEAIAINTSRQEAIALMQNSIDSLDTDFPKANLELSQLFGKQKVEASYTDLYKEELLNSRVKDSYSGRATFGIHRTDFIVSHRVKQRLARLCSTGEQKALLISIILSSIESILKSTNSVPILLLDELFVHLDEERRKQLSDYITSTKLQTFITTTDIIGIEHLARKSNIIEL